MLRKPRIHYEGGLYHVIARGNNGEFVFKEPDAKQLYLGKVFNMWKNIMQSYMHM